MFKQATIPATFGRLRVAVSTPSASHHGWSRAALGARVGVYTPAPSRARPGRIALRPVAVIHLPGQ